MTQNDRPEQDRETCGGDLLGAGGRPSTRIAEPEAYWTSRLQKDFSLGGVGNLPLGRPFNEWAYRARRTALNRCLRRFEIKAEGSQVLDIGVGTGFYLDYWLRRSVSSVMGVDISRVAVDNLVRAYPTCELRQQDISALDCPILGTFDIVTVFDVLFHLVDDAAFERAIANACRQVRKGGTLLLSDILSRRGTLRGETQFSRTLGAYEEALSRNGMEIRGFHPVFFSMSLAPDIERPWLRDLATRYWRIVGALLQGRPGLGRLLGPIGFIIDASLQSLCRDGPSVKVLVARRVR